MTSQPACNTFAAPAESYDKLMGRYLPTLAPAWKRTLAVLAAAGAAAAAALWLAAAQPAAAAATTGLQAGGHVSAAGPYTGSTDMGSLQNGLFLPSQLFIPTEPCLPPSLI